MTNVREQPSRIARAGFYIALILFLYGTLFPFQFQLSRQAIAASLHQMGMIPFWDESRHRVHSLTDILANFLLTVPLGFFGFLTFGHRKTRQVWIWLAFGCGLGMVSEAVQLILPSRMSDITDALNNGLGALAGAVAALVIGKHLLDFLEGVVLDREATYMWLVLVALVCAMLAPFDIGLNLSHARASVKGVLIDPWQSSSPVGDGWITTVEFALFGALAGRVISSGKSAAVSRNHAVAAVLSLPLALEAAQILFESHSPGLRSLLLGLFGVSAGLLAGMRLGSIVCPGSALLLLSIALVASGLSPFRFVSPRAHQGFQWIPLVEYYDSTSASALADAIVSFVHFALLGGLIFLSLKIRRHLAVFCAVILAACIELLQLFVDTRFAGTTDILLAALGGWTGATICDGIEGPPAERSATGGKV